MIEDYMESIWYNWAWFHEEMTQVEKWKKDGNQNEQLQRKLLHTMHRVNLLRSHLLKLKNPRVNCFYHTTTRNIAMRSHGSNLTRRGRLSVLGWNFFENQFDSISNLISTYLNKEEGQTFEDLSYLSHINLYHKTLLGRGATSLQIGENKSSKWIKSRK